MLILYFLTALCSTSESYSMMIPIFLTIDLIFLLFTAYSTSAQLKQHSAFILLTNGTTIIILEFFSYFPLHIYVIGVIICIIAVTYFMLCRRSLFTRVISTVNCVFLTGIVERSIFGTQIFSLSFGLFTLAITLALFFVLAILFINFVLKIHTVLVGYLLIAYILSYTTSLDLIRKEGSGAIGFVSLLVGSIIFGCLCFLEFML